MGGRGPDRLLECESVGSYCAPTAAMETAQSYVRRCLETNLHEVGLWRWLRFPSGACSSICTTVWQVGPGIRTSHHNERLDSDVVAVVEKSMQSLN